MILKRDPLRGLGLAELASAYLAARLGRIEGLRKLSYLLFIAMHMDPDTGGYQPLSSSPRFYLYLEGPMMEGLGGVVSTLSSRGVVRVRVEGFPGSLPGLVDYIDFYDCKSLRIIEPRVSAARVGQRLPEVVRERLDAVADKYGSATPSALERVLEGLGAGLQARLRRIGGLYKGPAETDGGWPGGVVVEARSTSKRYVERIGGLAFLDSTGPVPRLRGLVDLVAPGAAGSKPLIQPLVAHQQGVKCFDLLWAGPRGCIAAEVLDGSAGEALPAGLRLCLEKAAGGPCAGVVLIDCRLGGSPICGVVNVLKASPKGVVVLGFTSPETDGEVVEQLSSMISSVTGRG
ncbi:MAG: hypothetical protein GXO09_02635 [Crenarchaeota archaeon]|nr:hypothetical protein [Thermoproteota archaeon]